MNDTWPGSMTDVTQTDKHIVRQPEQERETDRQVGDGWSRRVQRKC